MNETKQLIIETYDVNEFDIDSSVLLKYKGINKEYVIIPNGVSKIGLFAFSGCETLKTVFIPNTVEYICLGAFNSCPKLEQIIFEDGGKLLVIADHAISNCKSLTKVEIPSSISHIGISVFDRCPSIQFNKYDNCSYLGNREKPYLVLFKANSKLSSKIHVHSDTKIIYSKAFKNYKNLDSINIPDNVISILDSAFEGCTSLKKVEFSLESQLKLISNQAFFNCVSLANINIPSSLDSLGRKVFCGCDSLKLNEYSNSLYLGNSIHPYLILIKAKNNLITKAKINKNTLAICEEAFKDCIFLTNINVPDKVIKIQKRAFLNCTELRKIKINTKSNLSYIGNEAFQNCSSLTEIYIPKNVKKINDRTFKMCNKLNTVNFAKNSKLLFITEEAFSNCKELKTFKLPTQVMGIGTLCFKNCTNLKKFITTNNSKLDYISDNAFSDCKELTSIFLPKRMCYIGNYAFKHCNKITIRFKNKQNAKSWGSNWNKINNNHNVKTIGKIVEN